MLNILDQEYYDKVIDFATKSGQLDKLQHELDYLANYAIGEGEPKDKTRCDLYKDFAPQSFYFILYLKQGEPLKDSYVKTGESPKDGYVKWFNGGLIYHGKHDNGGDGGAPTFSVNLTPQYGWSIHT
jgi:hypothetical protein